ncbi:MULTISPECIES: pentapeptide repeat-containing protein [unclassified Streptomyces]|uniref:pentapeptide repeat-containing protein n=1 Tax=unclassified Streptomyces TaxID=2593676 RepID=UPI0015CF1172|nr:MULTISPECIES: pentapeptide repeat-containing protein [unclassified Streptomyces]
MKREAKRTLAWGGCAIGAALFTAALIWGPWLFEGHHVRDSELVPSAGIIITGFRTMLVALAAGAIAGLGLYYTHRNHKHAERLYAHSQEQFAHARETDRKQARLTREGQVTGRYVEASKLLASENPTERLCGIYAFERIMRDSKRDHQTVVEVLAAFIRQGAERGQSDVQGNAATESERAPEDVIAAFAVIGRRPMRTEEFRTDLKITDLRGVHLVDSNLHRANLEKARMQSAVLTRANLRKANIDGAILERANLRSANLSGVDAVNVMLKDADLQNANLYRAELQDSDLRCVDLRGANLHEATLICVELMGADLRGANLHRATLSTVDLRDAELEGANLYGAQMAHSSSLTVEQLVLAKLNSSTSFPGYLADDPRIQARIKECEEERRRQGEM